jgi:hypothetical protein
LFFDIKEEKMTVFKKEILAIIGLRMPLIVSCTKVDSNKEAARTASGQKPSFDGGGLWRFAKR